MAKWGSADFGELIKLQQKLLETEKQTDEFFREASKVLAARLLNLVLPRTPRGEYPISSGKQGGTLKRGWVSKTHEEAVSGSGVPTAQAAKEFAMSLPIKKDGSNYVVEIINPVEYASYVEFGHRTVNGGLVKGQYFFTKSIAALEMEKEHLLQKQLEKFLKESMP